MKCGQLIEYKVRYIFLKSLAENEAGKLVPDLFLYFKKALDEVKASDWDIYKKKTIWIFSDCWYKDMLNFGFLVLD